MAKTKQQKEKIIKELTDKLKKAKSLVFVNFDGLKVKEVEELRKRCRQENVDYLVAKKTLMKIAFKDREITDIDPKTFQRGIAVAFGYEDEIAPARILENFSYAHPALQTIGGILDNKFISKEKVKEFATLPSREELLIKIVSSIKTPIFGFVNVLSGNLRNLISVLNGIKESKL